MPRESHDNSGQLNREETPPTDYDDEIPYDLEFERDFCIALNMMLGHDFTNASNEANKWIKEARATSLTAPGGDSRTKWMVG